MSTTQFDPEALLSDLAWMRRLAVSLVYDPTSAEDVVQDTWLAALKRRWPTGRPPRAWLSRVEPRSFSSRACAPWQESAS